MYSRPREQLFRTRRGPPDKDNFAAELGKFQGFRIQPVLEGPFGAGFARFSPLGPEKGKTRENQRT
jgi:hypothetical protein